MARTNHARRARSLPRAGARQHQVLPGGVRAVSIPLGVLGVAAGAQTLIFVLSGSVALLADLIHNFGDALTAVPLGIAFLIRSPRAERLAGLAVVAAIFISACVAAVEAVQRLIHPQAPGHLVVLAAAGAIGYAGNWITGLVRTRAGHRLDSPALIVDGAHARADAYVSLAVIASAIVVALGWDVKTIDNSTVLRIDLESSEGQSPKVLSEQVIAERIPWVDSPTALVLGPTGLALAANGTLYVASTQNNKILAISEAATRTTPLAGGGTVLTEAGHLKEPLGMVLAPNGDIITTNGGDGNMMETTPQGQQIAVQTADKKTGAGALFGLAIAPEGKSVYYVDDGENTLKLLQ